MPVLFDSSATSAVTALAGTGAVSVTHKVSPTAPNLYAFAAVYWAGAADVSAATITVSFGGHAMTAVTDGEALWAGDDATIRLFYLENPPTGAQTVTATLGTNVGAGFLALATATYSGIASIDTAVNAAGTTATAAALDVVSQTATMFVNAFGSIGVTGDAFSSYSKTSRKSIPAVNYTAEPLVMGDAAGTGTEEVTFEAVSANSGSWAGIGAGLIGISTAYDATGAGATGYKSSFTQAHTVGGTAGAVVVAVNLFAYAPGPGVTAHVGTAQMTQLGMVEYPSNYGLNGYLYLFGLLNPPTGPQNVVVQVSTPCYASVASVSYSGVSAFDTVATRNCLDSAVTVESQTPACRVIGVHGYSGSSPVNTFNYNQLKRAVCSYGANQVLLIGDAPGKFSVPSRAKLAGPSPNWGAIGINARPAPVLLNVSTRFSRILNKIGLADYRVQDPSPQRMWVIPDIPGKLPDGSDPPPGFLA
jgi:hypothetical protein